VCLQTIFRVIDRFFVTASQAFECVTGFHGDHSHGAGWAPGAWWRFNVGHLPLRFFRIREHPEARLAIRKKCRKS
jgi:hypothetical protein